MTTIDPALVEKADRAFRAAHMRSWATLPDDSLHSQRRTYALEAALSAVLPDALAEKDAEIERLTGRLRDAENGHQREINYLREVLIERDEARSRLARVLASVEALVLDALHNNIDDVHEEHPEGTCYLCDWAGNIPDIVADALRALLADAQATTDEAVDVEPLTEDEQANDCHHDSATGIDTAPIGPGKVWRCDHCGLTYTDAGPTPPEPVEPSTAEVEAAARTDLHRRITQDWLIHLGYEEDVVRKMPDTTEHQVYGCEATGHGYDCANEAGKSRHPMSDDADATAELVGFVLDALAARKVTPAQATTEGGQS